MLIPNFNTFADLVDRLSVEVAKLSWFENKKREEQGKENPDANMIAHWDNLSRDACELRNMLKIEINKTLEKIVKTKEYEVLKDARTFRPPKKSVADVLQEICEDAPNKAKEELIAALGGKLNGDA